MKNKAKNEVSCCSKTIGTPEAAEYSAYLFRLRHCSLAAHEEEKAAARGYDAFFRQVPHFLHRLRDPKQEKIRIGYISPFFCNHVVTRMSHALLTAYDRNRFTVFAYMSGKGDAVSCHLAEKADGWRDISRCTAAEAARAIYEDRIDILVDLSGHRPGNCLPVLACKPAPVQISGIAYSGSTGLSTVDYFLGDAFLDDEETEAEFTEQLLILPKSHFCYVPFYGNLPVGEAPCLKKGYITFGSFRDFEKAKDEVLVLWAKILKAVPGSRLLLKADGFEDEAYQKLSLERIAAAGIDLSRVELRALRKDHPSEYSDMDILLDTFPYTGEGELCDAVYMGVPVVTRKGRNHGGRFGWSILQNLGLGEFCAETAEEYVERAVLLASDRELLAVLRQNLRAVMENSALMDYKGYMAAVEQGYEMVWQHFLESQEPPSPREVIRLSGLLGRLASAGETEQALAAADALLSARPDSRDIAEKLCILYLDENEAEQAEKAVALLPEAHLFGKFVKARICLLQKNLTKAERICEEILEAGGLPYPWGGAEHNLLAELYKQKGDVSGAAREYRLACEAPRPKSTVLEDWSNYLLLLQYVPQSPEFLFREACRSQGKYAEGIRVFPQRGNGGHKKLRIGYLSPDFRRHVVACFSRAFFEAADKERFEVYGYAKCREDDVSMKMKRHADVWRNVYGNSPEEIARIIHEDEIDILVELAGHMGGNSLQVLAYRPAPLQLCGIGYFSTTGLSCVDGFLVDEYTALPGEENFFTEKLLRLPHSQFCYKQVLEVPETAEELPFAANGFLTFGSMNNINKISDEVVEAWGKILAAVPDSRLFLKSSMLDDASRRKRETERFASAGIAPSRLILEGFTDSYLREYRRMDIALDTFPYPGGGTTCDALYMGVPVVSLAGSSNHERFGLSLLSNLGLEELCSRTKEEYVACAVGLAEDRERLRRLHRELRDRMERSPVMDQNHYMKELEVKYGSLWDAYMKKNMR